MVFLRKKISHASIDHALVQLWLQLFDMTRRQQCGYHSLFLEKTNYNAAFTLSGGNGSGIAPHVNTSICLH